MPTRRPLDAKRRSWVFPTGELAKPATITFGFLTRPLDKFRYASSDLGQFFRDLP